MVICYATIGKFLSIPCVFFKIEVVASKKLIQDFLKIEILVREDRVKSSDLNQTKKIAARPLL